MQIYCNLNKLIGQMQGMSIKQVLDVLLKISVIVTGAGLGLIFPTLIFLIVKKYFDL